MVKLKFKSIIKQVTFICVIFCTFVLPVHFITLSWQCRRSRYVDCLVAGSIRLYLSGGFPTAKVHKVTRRETNKRRQVFVWGGLQTRPCVYSGWQGGDGGGRSRSRGGASSRVTVSTLAGDSILDPSQRVLGPISGRWTRRCFKRDRTKWRTVARLYVWFMSRWSIPHKSSSEGWHVIIIYKNNNASYKLSFT